MEETPRRLSTPVKERPSLLKADETRSKEEEEEREETKKGKGPFGLFHRRLKRSDSAFKNYISILIGYLDTVILYNFFFLGVSLGIVTIGPALVGMVDCYNEFLSNHTEHRYRLFFQKLKENFNLPNVIFGILLTGSLASFAYLFLFYATNWGSHAWIIPMWVITNVVMLYLVTSFSYYALGKVRMQLDTKTILSNSFKLAAGAIKQNLIAWFAFALFFLVPAIFYEYCIPLLVLLSLSGCVLSMMMACYPALDPFVILSPEEEEVEENPVEEKPNLRLDLIDQDDKKKEEK